MSVSEFEDAYDDKEKIHSNILATCLSDLNLRPPIFVNSDETVVAAVNAMNEHRTGCVLVRSGPKMVGILTERDVLTRVIFRDHERTRRVDAVMTHNPETLEQTASIAFAFNKMSAGGYRHIPIVDHTGKPVGVCSVRDLVDFVSEMFPDDIFNLPPTPEQAIPRTADGG